MKGTITAVFFIVAVLLGCSDDHSVGDGDGAAGLDSGSGSGLPAYAGAGGEFSNSGGSGREVTTGGNGETSNGGINQGSGGSNLAPDAGFPQGGDPDESDEYLPWEGGADYYAQWSNGPPNDVEFFPIAVWLQSPSRAEEYAAIGVNLFVGLWQGPTEQQLSALSAVTMNTICEQNGVWSSHIGDDIVWAWMHMDEPDNRQPDGNGGYGPCLPASEIVAGYQSMKGNDGTRPVYLNLGQGVANDKWVGRGSCTGTSDYPEYTRGCDILSFDVYPVNSGLPLWYVAEGVSRLREWANYEKVVWNWIETTGFDGPEGRPTPAQVGSEVWMALVHGSMGIGYFAHVFEPNFIEAGLLADEEMRVAIGEINAQITELAPVLNTPSIANAVTIESSDESIPVDYMAKRVGGSLYIFAVAMRDGPTTATFSIRDINSAAVDVLGESRLLRVESGSFEDAFDAYGVHLYEVVP